MPYLGHVECCERIGKIIEYIAVERIDIIMIAMDYSILMDYCIFALVYRAMPSGLIVPGSESLGTPAATYLICSVTVAVARGASFVAREMYHS